ncbi:MAG: hypothetical protein MK135_08535, partial [Polyangiaceae bacterium]|nr:hypothetical protein [Polyangiaceae bacterium]
MKQLWFIAALLAPSTLLIESHWGDEAHGQAVAEALFQSGKSAAARGDWQAACDRFAESHRIEPTAGAALNLGRCYEKLGQLASAWESYVEVTDRVAASDPRSSFAADQAERLYPLVPTIKLLLPAEWPQAARVTVDGRDMERGSFGLDLPYDPGRVEIVIINDGLQVRREEVTLKPKEHLVYQLDLGASVALSAPSAPGGEREPRAV